ncbi:hypothetical protein TorRG33x02_059070 [Trema orientale]|uniref:Uncharacterized protein n=1 Tax=Trema orientale TaxID=63057 RepID=A0A2P5FKK5_TREOI|nr:hypothetical protein TorRG33x02_059070 [Trema orientale]
MKVINKKNADTSNEVELWALGEHRWKLGRDQLRDEKYQTERMTLTLRDIMDTLSRCQKETLFHPFHSKDTVFWRNKHDYYRDLNSQFDELGSIDDFDRLKQFLQMDIDSIDNLSKEIRFYRGEVGGYGEGGGLKIEEKYLRQELVEVSNIVNGGNYKVMIPKTLAPIFKTLLLKYGHDDDFRGHLGLTDGMRSGGSTLLSIVIDKMCRTKIEDITMDLLKQCHFYLLGIQQITGFDLERYMNSLLEMGLYAYLGFKAVRSEKEVTEILDLKIATLEAEWERYKKNREEFKTFKPRKSSVMEKCLREASKRKQKTLGDLWF